MAISLIGGGGLFDRLGYEFGWVDLFLTAPIPNDASSRLRAMRNLVQEILIKTVDDDTPLRILTIELALKELIAQMTSSSNDVDANIISATPAAAGGNTGDGTLIASVENPDGDTFPYLLAEDIIVECIEDSQAGRLDAGSELFRIQGEAPVDEMDPTWPKGSGISLQTVSSSAEDDAGRAPGATVLTNGDFEDWSGIIPRQWTIAVGGSTISLTTTSYRGTNALKIAGDGSTLTRLSQLIDDQAGTFGIIAPWEKYLIAFRVRDDGTGPTAGVLSVALRNADTEALVGSAVQIDLTGVGSTYAIQTGVISTPAVLPSSMKFDLRLTAALENGRSVYIDQVQLIRMVQLYRGGPYIALISGATNWIAKTRTSVGDLITITIASDNTGEFLKHFERFFNMSRHDLLLPTDGLGGETIADTLIQ